MKDRARTNLTMIEDNLPKFNSYSLQFLDKKYIRKMISVWRWFLSHNYFKEGHPKPEGIASNPPISWMDTKLQGQSVPLHRDIAECIAPVVQSSLKTEHSARRIMDRMNSILHYVSPEAIERDQQEHRDREDKKVKDRVRAAKTRDDRKKKKNDELLALIEKDAERLAKKHLKAKNKQREMLRIEQEEAKKIALKENIRIRAKLKKEMRDRRDGS